MKLMITLLFNPDSQGQRIDYFQIVSWMYNIGFAFSLPIHLA